MSKVNIDEIKVGDLVRYESPHFSYIKPLGYVTSVNDGFVDAHWSDEYPSHIDYVAKKYITGHWKVINFEEETKMDELKVYTGKETIEALLEGKTLSSLTNKNQYKMNDTEVLTLKDNGDWMRTVMSMMSIMQLEFTEVPTPQVGDWVRISLPEKTIVGCIIEESSHQRVRLDSYDNLVSLKHYWEILTPEQVSEHKREQEFIKRGRKLNEFKASDIVFIDSLGVVATVITKMNNDDTEIRLHGINELGKGYKAKPHQLTPISFAEDQVQL